MIASGVILVTTLYLADEDQIQSTAAWATTSPTWIPPIVCSDVRTSGSQASRPVRRARVACPHRSACAPRALAELPRVDGLAVERDPARAPAHTLAQDHQHDLSGVDELLGLELELSNTSMLRRTSSWIPSPPTSVSRSGALSRSRTSRSGATRSRIASTPPFETPRSRCAAARRIPLPQLQPDAARAQRLDGEVREELRPLEVGRAVGPPSRRSSTDSAPIASPSRTSGTTSIVCGT